MSKPKGKRQHTIRGGSARKKSFLKLAEIKEKKLHKKMLRHASSSGYVEQVPDWPDCVYENR